MKTRTLRASTPGSKGHRHASYGSARLVAEGTYRNVLLDMIELLEEERRLDASQALSTQDAPRKAALEATVRECATAIFEIRRRLAPQHRGDDRVRASKRQFDTYLDNLLDTCFAPFRAEPMHQLPGQGTAHA